MADEPRTVLLDTCVLIAPPPGGFQSIPGVATVSSISIAEMEFGVDAPADPVDRRRRRRRLDVLVDTFEILPFDLRAAESYGLLANLVRVAGRDPRPRRFDLMIAATAERYGLSLATRNAEDFRHLERVLHVVPVA